jgi:hypothetical protein
LLPLQPRLDRRSQPGNGNAPGKNTRKKVNIQDQQPISRTYTPAKKVSYKDQQPVGYKSKKVSIQDQDSYTKGKGKTSKVNNNGRQRTQQGNQGQRSQQGSNQGQRTQQ